MLEIWDRGWNGQGVIKIKRTTFVHTRNICSESWVACLRSFSKLSTKNDCPEEKKSAQYNQYKLHEYEAEHAEGLLHRDHNSMLTVSIVESIRHMRFTQN